MGDIEKMLADAEKFAEEDREVAERVTAKNELEGLCYNLKKQAEDKDGLGGKLSESDKEKILEVVEEKLTWLRENGDGATAEEKNSKEGARGGVTADHRWCLQAGGGRVRCRGTPFLGRAVGILLLSCPYCKETLF